ncbi:hypothetical protein GEMRC1_001160 [Eukaryota sp. GEM-RC1]
MSFLKPVLNSTSSCFKTILFPTKVNLDFTVLKHLPIHTSIETVGFINTKFEGESCASVLRKFSNLHRLELNQCTCTFSPIFGFFEFYPSVRELFLKKVEGQTIDDQDFQSLVQMLKNNNSLYSLTIDDFEFTSCQWQSILGVAAQHPALQSMHLPSLDLQVLMVVYESMHINKPFFTLSVSPHFISTKNSVFWFTTLTRTPLTIEDASSLQSFLRFNAIKNLSLRGFSISDDVLNVLHDSIRFNDFLSTVDLSYCNLSDVVPIINAFHFKYSFNKISLCHNLLGFKCLLKVFEQILKRKLIPNVVLVPNIIDVSTGFIYTSRKMSDDDVISLLRALKSNVPIRNVKYESFCISTIQGLIALFEVLSINRFVMDVPTLHHTIDFENGIFLYSAKYRSYRNNLPLSTEEIGCLKGLVRAFNIKELTLDGCFFSDESIRSLAELIRIGHSLTSVELRNGSIFYFNFCKFLRVLSLNYCCNLKVVSLANNNLCCNSATALSKDLMKNTSITLINLSGNSIECEGAVALAEALKVNSSITTLYLDHNSIGSDGAIALAEALKVNSSIIELSLKGNQITSEVEHFLENSRIKL